MSSVGNVIKQRLTKSFVNTQNNNQGDQGPYYFYQSSVSNWISQQKSNGNIVQDVGEVITIKGSANFLDVMNNLSSDGNYQSRKCLRDLGKSLYIGDENNSDVLELRLVQFPTDTDTGYDGDVVYIVTANNASDIGNSSGRWMVRVARV
jgi:hypothetical protein